MNGKALEHDILLLFSAQLNMKLSIAISLQTKYFDKIKCLKTLLSDCASYFFAR